MLITLESYVLTGAMIGVGDRKGGVHAVPSY